MYYFLRSFMLYAFLYSSFFGVQGEVIEKDEPSEVSTHSTTSLPIALKVSDVEIFKSTLGPQKENQEVEMPDAEAEGEDNAQPDVDAVKEEEEGTVSENEEIEKEAEPIPESEVQPEPEPSAEHEQPKASNEITAKPEVDPEAESAPEVEPAAPVVEAKVDVQTEQPEIKSEDVPVKENDESEMPNDEPAKEHEEDKPKDVAAVIKNANESKISCFTCSNTEDAKCSIKPTKQVPCAKPNEGDRGKHNGCYTLHKVDTNTTMRGCVDELTEEGLKYCLTHEKLCNLCYNSNCNSQVAPANAPKLQLNIHFQVLLTTAFIVLAKGFTFV